MSSTHVDPTRAEWVSGVLFYGPGAVHEGRDIVQTVAARAAASPGWCTGMWVGQNIRTRLSPVAFRRWFLLGLLILGIYLVARSTV